MLFEFWEKAEPSLNFHQFKKVSWYTGLNSVQFLSTGDIFCLTSASDSCQCCSVLVATGDKVGHSLFFFLGCMQRLVFYGLASVFVFLLWAPPTVLQWPLYALKALWKDHYDQQELKKQD